MVLALSAVAAAAGAALSSPLESSPPLPSPPYVAFSSSSALPDSSSGPASDAATADSSSYPSVFLLGIFLPSLAVGLLIAYLHWAMRRYGRLRCPDGCFALLRRQREKQAAVAATREAERSAEAAGSRRMQTPLLADSFF